MSETTLAIKREHEYRLGLGEVLVAHGIHPDYGVPCLTFTKARNPGVYGSEAPPEEVSGPEAYDTLVLVFTTVDAVTQHVDRLVTVMREMDAKAKAEADAGGAA